MVSNLSDRIASVIGFFCALILDQSRVSLLINAAIMELIPYMSVAAMQEINTDKYYRIKI